MNETIDIIENQLRSGELILNPILCGQHVATLSAELSFYYGQISEIQKNRPTLWLKMRNSGEYKSDTATDRAWGMTEDGVNHEWFDGRIKRIKALITGLKALIRNAENEENNKY